MSSQATEPAASIPDPDPAEARGGRRLSAATAGWLLALLGWTVVLCFYDLGGGARFEPIDCWVAQTAREMLEAGQWLVPRFSGEVRMQKSPGAYWAVMLASLARGQPVDEISARIPNALSGVLLVAVVFWLARRIAGDRAAIFAGFATSASVLVLWWSHRGASDLGLATFSTLSLAAIWIASECERPGRRRVALWMLGYFAAGLAMLYKMPMPLVVVGLPAAAYVVLRRRWSILASRWHLVGLALFLLPWLPWAVAVTLVEDAALAKWKVEFFDRFTGDLPNVEGQSHWKFLFTYLGATILYCLPFTLSLPRAIWRGLRRQPGVNRDGTLFVVIWFASLLVFFTASAGKEWRYFLPALPPLFVLLGIELAALFDPARRARPMLDRAGAIAVWVSVPVAMIAGGIALHVWWKARGESELAGLHTWADVWRPYAVTAVLMTAGLSLAACLYVGQRKHAAFGLIVATMWATWFWTWPRFIPLLMSERPSIDFGEQLANPARVPRELWPVLRQVGSHDSRVTWYSDVRFPRLIDQYKLLEEQHCRRQRDYEVRRYGQEIVDRLAAPEPILLVAAFEDYVLFLNGALPELEKAGRPLPPLHLWLQSRYGREDRHLVLFGNRPPPYPEPKLLISDELRARLAEKGRRTSWPESARAGPASSPSAGGQ